MNQITPGKMTGKPAASRAARRQGLEIAFDPDTDPLPDQAPEPFPPAGEPERGSSGPAGEEPQGEAVREGSVRRAPRSSPAAAPGPNEPADIARTDGHPAPQALQEGPTDRRTGAPAAGGASAGAHAGASAPPPPRHADPAEAARALGIPLPLAKIEVTVSVEVGRTRLSLADLVSVEPGELVALDRMTNAPVDILVNGKPFARGEIVAIGERFGVRLTELLDTGDLA